ncbi:autoinducer binding domain-containing protein [Variovorax sp. RB2P76]|uniref:autoinducer binding domain-containing protein n=1 Tax=unclassified Variovorax TaxID=663243 RepID=UPI003F464FA1
MKTQERFFDAVRESQARVCRPWPHAPVRPDAGLDLDIRAALAQAEGVADVFDVVAESVRKLGFEQCAYGLRIWVPFTQQKTLMISNYDPRWTRRYQDAGYLSIDPTVTHGVRSNAPLVWSNGLFKHTPKLWSEARAFDLRVGWAQSCFEAGGSVGMLTLARSHEALSRAELRTREPDLSWLVGIAHAALSAAFRKAHCAGHPGLTAREIEVLRWMADGKTAVEAAILLRISVNTVNFHIKNVKDKLQAANKTSAVASAVALGLLN